jgi:hypothetical protein
LLQPLSSIYIYFLFCDLLHLTWLCKNDFLRNYSVVFQLNYFGLEWWELDTYVCIVLNSQRNMNALLKAILGRYLCTQVPTYGVRVYYASSQAGQNEVCLLVLWVILNTADMAMAFKHNLKLYSVCIYISMFFSYA